ncbi:mechanosensitive ion channel family protein [Acidovorax sp. GBBC 3334]|uniref:mechanosensitive ion channel family protein n=1 Tax=Acidovorax sp. GBBC 3334 TaxID=2940496 RepID=UPI002303810C|nr:mechanosensitive ion channel family protein [Acidovorax sp. GBBC 3334]MDA8454595.1 mechanosensitive ion channel family protein [Acidovorax sp. GBBC 3334]
MLRLRPYFPDWMQEWFDIIVPGLQIVLIVVLSVLLQRALRRLLERAGRHYHWPIELMVPVNGLVRWIIMGSAALLVLERLGVSATVLWTAFTGFAAVGAVAFFAAWSVLSNLFCALLIFTVGPFRLGDYIEVLDTAEKPGAKGRVVDINLLYTTLEDFHGTADARVLLQIPNALIFQRVVRRWTSPPPPDVPVAPAPPAGTEPAAPTPMSPVP